MPKRKKAKIRKTFTFTVDLDAMATEYGVTPEEAREMFTHDVESFTDPAEWCLAWPVYVTAITVPQSA
jgi:hypothetical protein